MKLRFALLELFCEFLTVFQFVEVCWDGMCGTFACCGVGSAIEDLEEDLGSVPSAFNSLHACSQALASRDEMYTFAPFAT